jgi:hypothetical protein
MRYAIHQPVDLLSELCQRLQPALGDAKQGTSDYMGGPYARFARASIRCNRDPIAGACYDERFPPEALLLEFDAEPGDEVLKRISSIFREHSIPFRFVDDSPED